MSESGSRHYAVQEIVDYIIDCIGEDPSTLAQCSLVSRNWKPRARYHLFSRVVFPIALRVGLQTPRRTLYDEVVQANPDLALCARYLHLYSDIDCYGYPAMKTLYLAQLSNLRNVHSLVIRNFTYESLLDVAKAAILTFPLLTTLVFEGAMGSRLEPAGSGPHRAAAQGIAVRATSDRSCALKELSLSNLKADPRTIHHQSFALAEGLGKAGELSSLRSLELTGDTCFPGLVPVWFPFIRAIGASLRHYAFSLHYLGVDEVGDFGDYQGLEEPRLRKFSLFVAGTLRSSLTSIIIS